MRRRTNTDWFTLIFVLFVVPPDVPVTFPAFTSPKYWIDQGNACNTCVDYSDTPILLDRQISRRPYDIRGVCR